MAADPQHTALSPQECCGQTMSVAGLSHSPLGKQKTTLVLKHCTEDWMEDNKSKLEYKVVGSTHFYNICDCSHNFCLPLTLDIQMLKFLNTNVYPLSDQTIS